MSTPPGVPGGGPGEPSEAELRAAYEAELSRISSTDVMLQATVSLLNIGGMRLGLAAGPDGAPQPERDLEQVREAIEGVRALLPILEGNSPQELRPLRDALSQLQMAYARETQGVAPAAAPEAQGAPPAAAPEVPPAAGTAAEQPAKPASGPAESSGRLWVPGR